MVELESDILKRARAILESRRDHLKRRGIQCRGPAITVWNAEAEVYTSELSLTLERDGEFLDSLEFLIVLNGKEQLTPDEAAEWLAEQIDAL